MTKVLVCGDKNWTDRKAIKRELSRVTGVGILVIHGGAQGADILAGQVASELGYKVWVVSAEWEKYGEAAGLLQRAEILNVKPDLILAFHPDLNQSKETKDLLKQASKMHIPYKHFTK